MAAAAWALGYFIKIGVQCNKKEGLGGDKLLKKF
jgi:hypothetical protein